ncbi:MAG: AAA family ATPase [Sedimenticola sp.]
MRLARVRLKNFRCYKDEIGIDIGKFTTLVGKNDAGKSTILDALTIFFDDSAPDADDGSVDGDKRDIRIICEFEDLPSSLVIDSDHKTDLAAEYLLNEAGRLEIQKIYDGSLKKPKLLGAYACALHPTVEGRDDLLTLKNSDLKKRAKELDVDTSNGKRVRSPIAHMGPED